MKTNHIILCTSVFLLMVFPEAKSQDNKHIIGISYGFQYINGDIWVGDPYNIWIDQTSSSIIEGFYYYKLAKHIQTGFYCDFETGIEFMISLLLLQVKIIATIEANH